MLDPVSPAREPQLERVCGDSWEYTSWRPPELAGVVDHLWAFTGPSANLRKRVFPNGCIELIVNLDEPYRVLEGGGIETLRDAFVGGILAGPMLLEQPRRQRCVSARLRPAAARALFGLPLAEITSIHVDLVDLLGAAGRELAERCAAAATTAARLAVLAAWLRARLAARSRGDAAIAWAVEQLESSGGATPIAELHARTGLGKAALAAAFRDRVGLTPKRFARVVRLRRALALLQRGDPSLAEVAYAAGFYDQPHMNAEFRALAGVTPAQFVASRHPVGDGSTATG
jgi:AraC-like DNA-binding protein